MSSCMNFPAGTTVQQKRDACNPQVYRYRFPQIEMANSTRVPEARSALPRDRDLPGRHADLREPVLDDPARHEGRVRRPRHAERLHRRQAARDAAARARRATSTAAPAFTTGAQVVDCHNGQVNGGPAEPDRLRVAEDRRAVARGRGVEGHRPPHGLREPAAAVRRPAVRLDAGRYVVARGRADQVGQVRCWSPTSAAAECRRAARRARPGPTTRSATAGSSAYPASSFKHHRPGRQPAGRPGSRLRQDLRRQARDLPGRHPDDPPGVGLHLPRDAADRRARTGSSWPGTRRARRSSTSPRTPNGTIDFKTPAGSSPRGRTSGCRRSSRPSATPTAPTPTGAPPATSRCRAPGRNAIDIYKVTLPAPAQEDPVAAAPGRWHGGVRHVGRLRHGVGAAREQPDP